MKKGIFFILSIGICLVTKAQTDTATVKTDTIQLGNMIIINNGTHSEYHNNDNDTTERYVHHMHRSNYSYSDFVLDLGFANFDDHTNYPAAEAQGYIINKNGGSPLGAHDFKLRQVKSSNVNIWLFMQRMNIIKHYVNLKYGFGLELNNYRFESPISFKESGPNPYNQSQNINHSFAFMDTVSFKKDKLSLDYITVPLMLNVQTNPNYSDKGLSVSFGISAGYLYGSRNKQVSDARGKHHNKGDFDNEKFKLAYIGELGLGKIRLYGSYSPRSVFTNGLDLRPYSIGIRFSKW